MTERSSRGEFDHYARLVRRLLGVPVGLVSLVEPERQVFVGAIGLPNEYMHSRETPLSHSFCQYVVKDARPLILSDAREDPRLSDNLAIEDLDVVAYAGWPVSDHTGRVIGSLCAIDSSPREWSAEDIETLEDLATACTAELSQRERADDATTALTSAEEIGEQTRALLALSTALSGTETLAEVAAAVVRISTQELGCLRAGVWLRDSELVEHESRSDRRLDRTRSRHPAAPSADSVETLTFVVDVGMTWASAETFASLPMDETNPLGLALRQGHLVTFETRSAQNDVFPHLANADQLGEARAFLPLRLGGRAFGALALIWPGRRSFSDQDRVSMAALASYTAQSIQRAQLLEGQADVALTLQHAMLTNLPQPEALTITARYRPAGAHAEVGGDWYDAVVTPSGATYVVIGDVVGHDMQAAAIMGQLRSMLRMTAWLSSGSSSGTPAREVELLDRALHDLGVETQATMVVGRIEQSGEDAPLGIRRLRWTNAGHPPPLLLDPDGAVRLLEDSESRGPMLGFMPETSRDDAVVVIKPGTRLLLYTDGLVERRRESIDLGLGRLLEAARRHAGSAGDEFLDRILDDLVDDDLDDDVAMLTVHFGAE